MLGLPLTLLLLGDGPHATATPDAGAPARGSDEVGGSRSTLRSSKAVRLELHQARYFVGIPPSGWPAARFDDGRWAVEPPPPVADGRHLFLRRRFDVDAARARTLELRVAYRDGFIARINGREVARRGVSARGGAVENEPAQAHGVEPESVYLDAAAAALTARDNVLAVEIRAGPGSPGPSGRAELSAFAGVRIVRGPYLLAPREGRVSVAFETDLPTQGSVTLEPDGREQRSRGRPTRRHVLALRGLPPGREIRYRVEATTASSMPTRSSAPRDGTPAGSDDAGADTDQAGPFSFPVLPSSSRVPLRFAVYGDMRAPGHDAHRQVVAGLLRERPALVLNTGDLVNRGSEESDWQRYFEITAPLGAVVPIVPALGNHDASRPGVGARRTWRLFGLSAAVGSEPGYTSFDIAGVHFVILDSNRWDSDAQRRWLVEDLDSARRSRPRAIFAFCHDGPWSHAFHGGNRGAAERFAPLLDAGGVDVLFSGHDHVYERGHVGGLAYVVSGGGGAPLYDPRCAPAGTVAPPAGSRPALPRCPATVAALRKEHHYVMVEVRGGAIEVCPRRPDGSALEPCTELKRRRRGQD